MLPRKVEKIQLEIGPLRHETPCLHFSATRRASTFIYHTEMVSSPVLRKHSPTVSVKLSLRSALLSLFYREVDDSYELKSQQKIILLNKHILKLQQIRGTFFLSFAFTARHFFSPGHKRKTWSLKRLAWSRSQLTFKERLGYVGSFAGSWAKLKSSQKDHLEKYVSCLSPVQKQRGKKREGEGQLHQEWRCTSPVSSKHALTV